MERRRQATKELRVRDGLTAGRDRRAVEREIQMTPRRRQIEVLDLARGRQHVVGEAGRLGDEEVVHDGEEVVAQQPLANLVLMGHRHERIGAVHHQRADRRIKSWVAQVLTEVAHVERPHPGAVDLGHQHAVHRQRGELQRMRRARQASAAMAPRAAQRGQAGQRAELHRAVTVMLDADQRS